MKPIDFTDNTNKNFICVSSGYEPKHRTNVLEHWFVFDELKTT